MATAYAGEHEGWTPYYSLLSHPFLPSYPCIVLLQCTTAENLLRSAVRDVYVVPIAT